MSRNWIWPIINFQPDGVFSFSFFLFFIMSLDGKAQHLWLLAFFQSVTLVRKLFNEQVEFRKRAVYSTMNERLNQVQEIEEKVLRFVIGQMMKVFQACSSTNSSRVGNGIHTFSCLFSFIPLLMYNKLLKDLAAQIKKQLSFQCLYVRFVSVVWLPVAQGLP